MKITTVQAQESGERIDALLARSGYTRSAAARLVHHDEIRVLVNNVERDILRRGARRGGRIVLGDEKHVPRAGELAFLDGFSLSCHLSGGDEPRGGGPAQGRRILSVRGQPRAHGLGKIDTVVASHRDVVGDPQSCGGDGVQAADGGKIIGKQNAGWRLRQRQQRGRLAGAALRIVVAPCAYIIRLRLQPQRLQRPVL